jgi:NAD+ kinase
MKIGIVPNLTKPEAFPVLNVLLDLLVSNDIEFCLSNSMLKHSEKLNVEIDNSFFATVEVMSETCDLLISIGGDGTMLKTAFYARKSQVPMLGINLGKLGFLAEFEKERLTDLINAIQNNEYTIEERIALSAICDCKGQNNLYAINDLVIDRGRWPKMIQIHLAIDGREVSSFSADGIIIATPTGSTGYSLSTGGPIVSPRSSSITISPISPHTLNMRPLVLSSNQEINIKVYSPTKIQVSTDGQRVHYYDSPLSLSVKKAENKIKLFHTKDFNYFELLRKKLFWGLDVRKNEE